MAYFVKYDIIPYSCSIQDLPAIMKIENKNNKTLFFKHDRSLMIELQGKDLEIC